MLLETLKLLVDSGENALMSQCKLSVDEISISSVPNGQITFPAIAKINFQGGNLQSVRLGGDSLLCGHLAELVHDSELGSGIEPLARGFMTHAVEGMEGRYPRGEIENLNVEPCAISTRGVRSFGFRFHTAMGTLFALAEVPSRFEMELAKGSEYLADMLSTYLPRDWMLKEAISTKPLVDSFLVLLRKTEGDIYVKVPGKGIKSDLLSGLLLEMCTNGDQRAMRINLDLGNGSRPSLQPGTMVPCFIGLQDRSLETELEYLGSENFPVTGKTSLQTGLFAVPETFRITQKRKAFRIGLLSTVPVEIEVMDKECRTTRWFGDEVQGNGKSGRLVDLSFSGARVIGQVDDFCAYFPENTKVRCRFFFPDEPKPIQVIGLVRRSLSRLVDRETFQDELGIEFLVSPDIDSTSMESIRQYVLKEQRSLLARRVHVSG